MKIKNIILALRDQGPARRFIRNFCVTGHAWGLFHKNSHISAGSGKPKVMYNTKPSAERAARSMSEKHGVYFSNYKCIYCDGYHLGKNRDNKQKNLEQR